MRIQVVDGDILTQKVDVIVNSYNRNFIPFYLLLPHGVSGAIKKHGGYAPFWELNRAGVLPLGGAVLTGAGKLPYKGIIHVASIGHLWVSSEKSIRLSVRNAIELAKEHEFQSIAFPLLGAGVGGSKEENVLAIMQDELSKMHYDGGVTLVRFRAKKGVRSRS
jgi:O-acetyl-ADP-ribose deacetylase (regulator of RNase III)